MILGWWTRASGGESVAVVADGAKWGWPVTGRRLRVYPPRIRNEYWVETGHQETDDPATDTRED
jgi:hypothetical protein